ncbi:MAG: arylsulfatase [Planctomycetales bacterium]|nr:arylsulfatase [Planctomycetales bacterium]
MFLRTLLLTVVFFLLSASAPARDRPNILIIYTDDQGYGDVSCLNPQAKFQTPNMDRLAREGIAFLNGHSSDTVCTPSRYGLLTGRYSWRTQMKAGVMGAEGQCLIAPGRMTLASMLREQGYDTAMVGKWHLGMDFPGTDPGSRDWSQPVQDMPLDKGFDYFFGIPASMNYGVLAWFEGRYAKLPPTLYTAKKPNDRHVDYRIMPPYQNSPQETAEVLGTKGMEVAADFVDNQCLTRFTDKAIQWMQERLTSQHNGNPFFLYLPFTAPHYPVCPLPEFWGQGQAGGYGEFVLETDYHVGRILDFLDKSELAANTLIIFTSDNGPENSWRQRVKDFGHHSNHIYRGGKRDIYEGGHRVPFLVRWPVGIAKPGRLSDALVGQVDVLATLAEIVGSDLPHNAAEDSQSFAQLLREPTAVFQRLPLINHSAQGRFAITDEHWKLILPHRQLNAELYNLNSDPGEARNVIDMHPEVAVALEERITEIVVSGRTTSGPNSSNDTGYWSDLAWIPKW